MTETTTTSTPTTTERMKLYRTDDAPQHVRNAAGRVPMAHCLTNMETSRDAFLVSSTCY